MEKIIIITTTILFFIVIYLFMLSSWRCLSVAPSSPCIVVIIMPANLWGYGDFIVPGRLDGEKEVFVYQSDIEGETTVGAMDGNQ